MVGLLRSPFLFKIMINCYICGQKTSLKNNIIALSNRMILCLQCFKKHNGFTCKYCNLTYIDQDYNKNENCCKYCFQGMKLQNKNNNLKFHNYYFKPYPVFYPSKKDGILYLGLQLQIGGVKDYNIVNKFAAYNENNFFYIKKDSTIPQYGCEIVSYPATLEYHLSKKSMWRKILRSAKLNKFKSYNINDCGLHIHVNKSFFTTEEIGKLDCFVNENQQFFQKISRRYSQFSRFLKKPLDLYGKPINQNRHCALNLCNKQTIQFRMFKGTINYKSIMSYIQFVHYLCLYIKQTNTNDYKQFLKYVNNIQTVYLFDFLNRLEK